jgi:hypothetical protein
MTFAEKPFLESVKFILLGLFSLLILPEGILGRTTNQMPAGN